MAKPSPYKRMMILGRSSECDVVLSHPEVSSRHAVIVLHADGVVEVRDVGSKNGTYVNGQKVLQAYLNKGDQLQLGSYVVDWEEILRNPPAPLGGSDAPTQHTRLAQSRRQTLLYTIGIILAIVISAAVLWWLVS
ncbi:MAG: FHA domain-containing protein, partial [Bacteroidia bacterium]|nr:FHA domain-containing protein [Bacteroidia bacterium]MDW8235973.1 FHA domain-containing protein [Bacteroidia bacterium]